MRVGAGDECFTCFQRLGQAVEHGAGEFWQFIQKQHAIMRQTDLSRRSIAPATDHRRHGRAVVWIHERTATGNAPFADQSGHGVDHGNFQRLNRVHRRQNTGQTFRQHRFARAERPDHQHVMAARSGDF